TAGEFLTLSGRLSGRRHDVATSSLDLDDYLHTRMADLSPGLQRRLALASALIPSPDVLVLDEPTVGLERVEAEGFRRRPILTMEDRTTLLCTQDWAEARQLCDTVVWLQAGRVAATGTWDQLRIRSLPRFRVEVREGPEAVQGALPESAVH